MKKIWVWNQRMRRGTGEHEVGKFQSSFIYNLNPFVVTTIVDTFTPPTSPTQGYPLAHLFLEKRPRPDFIDKATRQRHGYHRFTGNHNHTEEFKRNLSKHDTGNCHTQRAGRGGERPNVRKWQHQIIRQGSSRISEKPKPEFCWWAGPGRPDQAP